MSGETTYLNPLDWIFIERDGLAPYPFTEDENANITGLGHQDPKVFAAEIDRYDREVGGFNPDELGDWASSVVHNWARLTTLNGEPAFVPCGRSDAGPFPITCLWGER